MLSQHTSFLEIGLDGLTESIFDRAMSTRWLRGYEISIKCSDELIKALFVAYEYRLVDRNDDLLSR